MAAINVAAATQRKLAWRHRMLQRRRRSGRKSTAQRREMKWQSAVICNNHGINIRPASENGGAA